MADTERTKPEDWGTVVARFPGPVHLGEPGEILEEYAIVAGDPKKLGCMVLGRWRGKWLANPSGHTDRILALALLAAILHGADRGDSARDVLDTLAAHAYFASVLEGVDLSDRSQWGETIDDPRAYLEREFGPIESEPIGEDLDD